MSDPSAQLPDLLQLSQDEFGLLLEHHRREIQVHCYRLMGTPQDAEDMVQETFLRAWRSRNTCANRASFRAWLYKIATHVCLDALKSRSRRFVPLTHEEVSTLVQPIPASIMEPIWLEPYPDNLLCATDDDPEDYLTSQENIKMAFLAALHLLPPRQRAILILRDVLEWPTHEVAILLDTTESAVKSALHRARSTLSVHNDSRITEIMPTLDDFTQHRLLDYIRAWEAADIPALLQLLQDDATFSMPPIPSWYRGKETIRQLTAMTIFSGDAVGRWRLLPTRANRQIAFGLYRHSESPHTYTAYGIQLLTFRDTLIADIITFRNPALFPYFKLPTQLIT